jgi:hypothetical protein
MAYEFNGSSDAMEFGSAPVAAVPLTICAWVRPAAAVISVVAAISTHTGAASRFQLNFNASLWTFQAVAVDDAAVSAFSEVSFSGSLGSWYHVAAVYASSTNRTAYVNGTAGAVSSTSIVTAAPTRFNIGGRYSGGVLGGFFNGAIAEVSLYNAALTPDEIIALYDGFRPDLIRPRNLILYPDLIRTLRDRRSGSLLSAIGSPTIVPHPRRIG